MIFFFEPMTLQQFLILIGAGAGAAVGQFGITAAYKYAPAREISIYDYTLVIFAAIWSSCSSANCRIGSVSLDMC